MTKGIDNERLIAVGYDKTNPIIPEEKINKLKNEEEKENAHRINRRIEFRVINNRFGKD